jgi:hypothetical protein
MVSVVHLGESSMTSVIVYPYIVPDIEWLKIAALLWDKVHRISSEFSPDDPEEVHKLDSAVGGLLKPEEVTSDLGYEAGLVFEPWLRTHYEDLRKRGLLSRDWMNVYPDKFMDGSVELLSRFKVIRDADKPECADVTVEHLIAHARQYRLPKVIAVHYLSVIASLIAKKEGTDLFAEERESARTAISSRENIVGQVATTTLDAYLPDDLAIEKIVELRNATELKRLEYQAAIASIVEEIEKVSSKGELDKIARRAEDLAKARIEEAKKKYRLAKLGIITKSLGVSLAPPALAASISSLLGIGIFMPAAVGAAICLAGAELLASREKAKIERDNTKWSLIFQVNRS